VRRSVQRNSTGQQLKGNPKENERHSNLMEQIDFLIKDDEFRRDENANKEYEEPNDDYEGDISENDFNEGVKVEREVIPNY